jgi:hypothetical protein
MKKFDLPNNYLDNPEALFKETRAKLRKTQPSSSLSQLESWLDSENRTFVQNLTPAFEAMANKSLREFSAPTTDNIHTRPAADIDKSFELKPVVINMVQASQFCGKAHEDASAHLQHFLEICSTSPSRMSPEMLYYFASSHFHSWGEQSSGSMPTRRRIIHG